MEKAQGFERQEYAEKRRQDELHCAIKEAFRDVERGRPNVGLTLRLEGDSMTIFYQTYESNVRDRIRDIEAAAKKLISSALSEIKKGCRSRKVPFDPKERKGESDYSIEKVSLNDRYLYRFWKRYRIA